MIIYEPSDDSYIFSEFLENYLSNLKNKNISFLDMGTGSGILSKTASKFISKKNIVCADINKIALDNLKKENFKTIHSNLFSKISKNKKFDIIVFNAPYLPDDKAEDSDSKLITTGGKLGDEISLKFLKQSQNYIKKDGKIFLLISSLTPMQRIKKFNPKIVARKKIWFEELIILEISF